MTKLTKGFSEILIIFAVFIILFIVGIFLYFQASNSNNTKDLDKVTVRLKWLHQTQFAGHYIADQKGFYKDNGIEVELLPFDYENFPIEDVVVGKAQFGVTGAAEILKARLEGKPVRAIATIYQKNPVTAYALKSSGIDSPDDFIDKKVGIQYGINVEFLIQAMVESVDIDYSDLDIIPIEFDVDDILTGKVDVASGYITNEPILLEEKGYEVNTIFPGDYDIESYGDVLFTTENIIRENPDLVKRFVKATLDGWEYAVSNVDEAVNTTLMYDDPNNEHLNYDHQKILLERSIPLIKPNPNEKIGHMSFTEWKRNHDLLVKYKVIDSPIKIDDSFTVLFIKN